MLIGYARVSTEEQDTALQRDALTAAGCERLFEETASGSRIDRAQLQAAIEFARRGDTIVVWKLDRLARSLSQLIQTVEALAERGIGIRSLTETIDSASAGGKLIFHIFGALAEFERLSFANAPAKVCWQHASAGGLAVGPVRYLTETSPSPAPCWQMPR